MSYHYPLDETWSKQEIIDVVNFFSTVERAYEQQVSRKDLLAAYTRFKQIVPSKSEEKALFAEFKNASGYACYPVVKKAREQDQEKIKMD
ncbi:UPF0223 family protein [Virgibacillus kekensis]|uniref:UPF0223 protein ACFO3D_01940 n=1 Tax=Virgibacillus kekensis TaxID=202261 RepID=A0ABV9DF71_9BACI